MARPPAPLLPLLLAAAVPAAAPAQDAPPFVLGRPDPAGEAAAAGGVLVIDLERVLAESARGRALIDALDADTLALEAENREIEARLRAEERALTERRPEMEPDAFRAESGAFDARVQEIRATQDAKGRALLDRREEIRGLVLEDAVPILAAVLQERGAVVILDRRSVFLSADAADVTSEVVRRIDAAAARRGPSSAPGPQTPEPQTPEPPVPEPQGGEPRAPEPRAPRPGGGTDLLPDAPATAPATGPADGPASEPMTGPATGAAPPADPG